MFVFWCFILSALKLNLICQQFEKKECNRHFVLFNCQLLYLLSQNKSDNVPSTFFVSNLILVSHWFTKKTFSWSKVQNCVLDTSCIEVKNEIILESIEIDRTADSWLKRDLHALTFSVSYSRIWPKSNIFGLESE